MSFLIKCDRCGAMQFSDITLRMSLVKVDVEGEQFIITKDFCKDCTWAIESYFIEKIKKG